MIRISARQYFRFLSFQFLLISEMHPFQVLVPAAYLSQLLFKFGCHVLLFFTNASYSFSFILLHFSLVHDIPFKYLIALIMYYLSQQSSFISSVSSLFYLKFENIHDLSELYFRCRIKSVFCYSLNSILFATEYLLHVFVKFLAIY